VYFTVNFSEPGNSARPITVQLEDYEADNVLEAVRVATAYLATQVAPQAILAMRVGVTYTDVYGTVDVKPFRRRQIGMKAQIKKLRSDLKNGGNSDYGSI
jgi:hypothetical protein